MNVGEMQRKLSRWAEQDKSKQFYGLYDLLCDQDWLRLAHAHVAQNAGSITAGCGGLAKIMQNPTSDRLLQTSWKVT